jgi:flagellar biosynthetic protein FlhB
MAEGQEDDNEKTEEPTQKRLEDAFEKGQVALSREIVHWMMLAAMALVILVILPITVKYLTSSFQHLITQPHLIPMDDTGLHALFNNLMIGMLACLGLPLFLLIIVAIASGLLQTRMAISWEAIQPKFDKISPLTGLKKLFSKRSLIEFIKNLTKLLIIAITVVISLRGYEQNLDDWVRRPIDYIIPILERMTKTVFIAVLSVLGVIAILDYLYQRYEHLKKMRMSREDIKKEHKESDGDPHIKQRIRQLRMERMNKRMMAEVPQATVVITNPTHFAVALRYESEEMNAPKVVAKGQDFLALKIREVATENKIPIYENPPLARALYSSVDLDQEIPPEHYKAVAEVIRYIMALKKRHF